MVDNEEADDDDADDDDDNEDEDEAPFARIALYNSDSSDNRNLRLILSWSHVSFTTSISVLKNVILSFSHRDALVRGVSRATIMCVTSSLPDGEVRTVPVSLSIFAFHIARCPEEGPTK